MTYRELLKIEHPENVDGNYLGGCRGCPGHYFDGAPKCTGTHEYQGNCFKCWDQEIPDVNSNYQDTDAIRGNDVLEFISKLSKGISIAFGGDVRVVPEIKRVIFNDPATIVFWEDGTKTVVKATNEAYDPEKGLAMAISRKALGNTGSYYNEFEKWLDAYKAKTTTFELKLPTCQEAIDALKQLGEKLKKGGIK